MHLGHIDAELVALFQHSSASLLYESIEACGELIHAIAQIIEPEVDGRKLVGH